MVNAADGTPCDGAGFFCALGICGNCQPAGASCAASPCCAGVPCDSPANYCVTCDVNHVQTNPAALIPSGGGLCEASCGASAQCDEKDAGAFVPPGRCNAQCTYKDGDPLPADCSSATSDLLPAGLNRWGMGGEVSPAACCGDDAGENGWYRKCSGGNCIDDIINDRACCDAPNDCVYNRVCYSAVGNSTQFLSAVNTAFCTSKPNEIACTSGDAKIRCQWTGSSCVPALTRAAVQLTFKSGNLSAYADVNGDGKEEVCVAGSPGHWESASGSVSGFVRNVSTANAAGPCPPQGCPVSGAVVKVLGTALSATSAPDGSYSMIGVPSAAYNLVAAKTGYDAGTAYDVFVSDGITATADFKLVQALGNCEDDCTTVGSNLCDASCHGKGLCWFYNDQTRSACDGTFGLIGMPSGQNVECCKGQPYSPIKADVTVRAKEIIKTITPVVYQGKLVKLVTLLFIPER